MIDNIDTLAVWRKVAPNRFEVVRFFAESPIIRVLDLTERENVYCRVADNLAAGVAAQLVSNAGRSGSMIAFSRGLKIDAKVFRRVFFIALGYHRFSALFRRAGVAVALSIDIDGRLVQTNKELELNASLLEKSALSWATEQLQKVT